MKRQSEKRSWYKTRMETTMNRAKLYFSGSLLMVGCMLACLLPYTAQAVDEVPDVYTLVFPTLHPKSPGHNVSSVPIDYAPGVIRYVYETVFEKYWKQISYHQADPNTGEKICGFSTQTKTYGYGELPWPVTERIDPVNRERGGDATFGFGSGEINGERLGSGTGRYVQETYITPSGFGNFTTDPTYMNWDRTNPSNRAPDPLLDDVWTPGEHWRDLNSNGWWDAEFPGRPNEQYWNATNRITANSCNQNLLGNLPQSDFGYSKFLGELFADYNNNVPGNAGTGFNNAVPVRIADSRFQPGMNVEITLNELDLTPGDQNGLMPTLAANCPDLEGDLDHFFVPSVQFPVSPQVATNAILKNGLFDFSEDNNDTVIQQAVANNGVAIFVSYFQYQDVNGNSLAPGVIGSNDPVRVDVPVYRAHEIYGDVKGVGGGQQRWGDTGATAITPNYEPEPMLDRNRYTPYQAGTPEEPYEDYLSWWDPFSEGYTRFPGPSDTRFTGQGFSSLAITEHPGSVKTFEYTSEPTIPLIPWERRKDHLVEYSRYEYETYIMNNYCGDVAGLLARTHNGRFDGPDFWVDSTSSKRRPEWDRYSDGDLNDDMILDGVFNTTFEPLADRLHTYTNTLGQVVSMFPTYPAWDDRVYPTWQDWWEDIYCSKAPLWYGQAPLPNYPNSSPGNNYLRDSILSPVPQNFFQTVPTDVNGVIHNFSVSAYTSEHITGGVTNRRDDGWYPQTVYGYDGDREFIDLASSMYHLGGCVENATNIVANQGMIRGDILERSGVRRSSGDMRLGERSDPTPEFGGSSETVVYNFGRNYGDSQPFTVASDGAIISGGPFCYNGHGNAGMDACDMLTIEMMTRRSHPDRDRGGITDYILCPELEGFRDCNLDGMVDVGGRNTGDDAYYPGGVRNDGPFIQVNINEEVFYPFNHQRYIEDCIEIWDASEDFASNFLKPNLNLPIGDDLANRIPLYATGLYPPYQTGTEVTGTGSNQVTNVITTAIVPNESHGLVADILVRDSLNPVSFIAQAHRMDFGISPAQLNTSVLANAAFGIGNVVHGFGHDVHGWPELYDLDSYGLGIDPTNVLSTIPIINGPIGGYDPMSGFNLVQGIPDMIGWPSNNTMAIYFNTNYGYKSSVYYPAPINKQQTTTANGWHEPNLLTNLLACSGQPEVLEFYPVESFGNNYFLWPNPNSTVDPGGFLGEYFYIYYSDGSSRFSPNKGIYITHTDYSYTNAYNPYPGSPPNGGGNFNAAPQQQRLNNHFTWELIQADGLSELQDNTNLGILDASDPFPGDTDQFVFSADTIPPARWWDQEDAGIRIVDIIIPTSPGEPAIVKFECYDIYDPWNYPEQGADSDNDGIIDAWEYHFFGDDLTAANATTDADSDGLLDLWEFFSQSDPLNPFSLDSSGALNDYLFDADGDFISNGDEQDIFASSPADPDTDDDGIADGLEIYPLAINGGRVITSPVDSRSPLIERSMCILNRAYKLPDPFPEGMSRFNLDEFTLEAWVCLDSAGQTGSIISRDTVSGQQNYDLRVDNGVGSIRYTTEAGLAYFVSGAPLAVGQWTHIAGVYDKGEQKLELYADGILIDDLITFGSPATGDDLLTTQGGDVDFTAYIGDSGLSGYIDEVRIWSVPHTAAEILFGHDRIVNTPSNATGGTGTGSVWGVGLVANYRFDDWQNTLITNKITGIVQQQGFEDFVYPLDWQYSLKTNGLCMSETKVVELVGTGVNGDPIDDINEDGIPNWWHDIFFDEYNEADFSANGIWHATQDPDGDGCSNLDEYLDDTNPENAGDSLNCSTNVIPISTNVTQIAPGLSVVISPEMQTILPGESAILNVSVINTGSNNINNVVVLNTILSDCDNTFAADTNLLLLLPLQGYTYQCETPALSINVSNVIEAFGTAIIPSGGLTNVVGQDFNVIFVTSSGDTNVPEAVLFAGDCAFTEALDALEGAWNLGTTQAGGNWYCQSNEFTVGQSALQVGGFSNGTPLLGDSQSSYVETTVLGPGELCFDYKVSTEPPFFGPNDPADYFNLYINGVLVERWSGEIDWDTACFQIPGGPTTVRWEYSKDNFLNVGQDSVWLDNVIFVSSSPDSDGDGLADSYESFVYGTDPTLPDTDGDGTIDGIEIQLGFNPLIDDMPVIMNFNTIGSMICFDYSVREGITYIVQQSNSLAAPNWSVSASGTILNEQAVRTAVADGLHTYCDPLSPTYINPPCYRIIVIP